MASSTTSTALIVVAVLLVTITEAQNTPSCAQKLIPCASYLGNDTETPPISCCNPIREAVANELTCLCNLYNTPGLLASFRINVTQALGLTRRCGINSDLSACSRADAPSATTSPPPPGVPGNDGGRMAWTGFSSLLLLWSAYLFY